MPQGIKRRLTAKQWSELGDLLESASAEYPKYESFRMAETLARFLEAVLEMKADLMSVDAFTKAEQKVRGL